MLTMFETPLFDGISLGLYMLFFVASIIGGMVGSLCGGSGMITMPLLLVSGINPLHALATNKLQACIGSFTSAAHYYHQGLVDPKQSWILLIIAALFGGMGTFSVQFIEVTLLSKILPFVIVAIGIYFLLSPHINDENKAKNPHKILLFITMGMTGFYGGFLGVGIGSFVLTLLVSIGGYGISKALAHSRWIVFSINIVSTTFFILSDNVLWVLGIVMCIGQIIGTSIGAKLAIKHGAKIIRPIVICMCFALSAQLFIREFL